jgi:ATP-dependent DNA ligase
VDGDADAEGDGGLTLGDIVVADGVGAVGGDAEGGVEPVEGLLGGPLGLAVVVVVDPVCTIVFRDGDQVELGSRNERPMTRYFPEIIEAVKTQLPGRCVVDAEIVVPDASGRRLDFEALLLRIHPTASRVALLAEQTPARLVAFDLLCLGDLDYTGKLFRRRRAALEQALARIGPPVYLTPATTDRELAAEWLGRFEGAGLDGLVAKLLDGVYEPDRRVWLKVKHQRTADCVVGGYRLHKRGEDLVGSLLLGCTPTPAS